MSNPTPNLASQRPSGPSGHVLIVDDTPENIQVLGSLLRESDYDINVATSGKQALETLERVHPDLVLLDIMMPDMDGYEVCRRMKENPITADIPVIFLTAKTETNSVVRGFELGAVDYVTKPFQAPELLQRVDTHLTLSRLRGELESRVEDLSRALGQIDQLNREQDAFLRHELNNVINPIAGYADMLRTVLGGSVDEKALSWLDAILRGTSSMQRILTDIKRLSAIERGAENLAFMPIPLYGILVDIIADVRSTLVRNTDDPGTEGSVIINLLPESLDARIQADLSFLPGVFKNVIKNAAEHVLETSPNPVVTVSCTADEAVVTVDVHNGGDPVPPERLATFFDRFNSTKLGQGGTGLGTTYARIVTEAHGGSISVSSSAEDGTRVRISLPRVVS